MASGEKKKSAKKPNKEKGGLRVKFFGLGAIFGLLLCVAGLFCWHSLSSPSGPSSSLGPTTEVEHGVETEVEIDIEALNRKIAAIEELATAEATYASVSDYVEDPDWIFIPANLQVKRFTLVYTATVKAGVDLGECEMALSENVLTIKMPDPCILSHEIDEESVRFFDGSGVLNQAKIEDFIDFRAEVKAQERAKLEESEILVKAKENAQSSVRSLVETIYGDGIEIRFEGE